jgi:hypothetical protein
MSSNLHQPRVWSPSPVASFDTFAGVKDFLSRTGRYAIKNGSESNPFLTITYQCTQATNKACEYRLKCKFARGPDRWLLFDSGDHRKHEVGVSKGMSGPQRVLVDRLIAENPFASCFTITDMANQHDFIRVDVSKVRQRMAYLSQQNPTLGQLVQFDGSISALKALLTQFAADCKLSREGDKPLVKILGTEELGRYNILVSTRELLSLLKFGSRKCLYVDATHSIFKPHEHKILSTSVIDGSNKYFTCVFQISIREDKITYQSLAQGISEWMFELFEDQDFQPTNVCADGLPFISRIWEKSTRLMCAEHLRRLLRGKLSGREAKSDFSEAFQALRRSPNSVILEKAVSELLIRYPSVSQSFRHYLEGGELGRWCRAQVNGIDSCVSFVNNPSEVGNSALKVTLKKAEKSSRGVFYDKLKYLISVYTPEQSSRMLNESARVCQLFSLYSYM